MNSLFHVQQPFSSVLETVVDAVMATDTSGRTVYANAAAARILGFNDIKDLLASPPHHLLAHVELLDENGVPVLDVTGPGWHTDLSGPQDERLLGVRNKQTGEERWLAVKTSAVRGPAGEVRFAVTTLRDMTAQRLVDSRARFLLEMARRLSKAVTAEQVASVVVEHALAGMGGAISTLFAVTPDGQHLELLSRKNLSEQAFQQYRILPMDAPGPIVEAVREQRQIWLETADEHIRRYPEYAPLLRKNGVQTTICVPLILNAQVIGGLSVSFTSVKRRTEDEETFLLTLAEQGAQALERARLYDAEREARAAAEQAQKRLKFLAEASSLLGSSLDFETTMQSIARLATPEFADWCMVEVVDTEGTLQNAAVSGPDLASSLWAEGMRKKFGPDPDAPRGAYNVLRTCQSELHSVLTDEQLVRAARSEEHLEFLRGLGLRSLIIVPLVVRDHALGTMSLIVSQPGREFTEADLALAEDLARRAALAVDNARLFQVLVHERNLLRTLIDSLPEFVFVKDDKSRFLISNASHDQNLRERRDIDIIGKTDFDFYAPDLAQQFYEDDQHIMRTGEPIIDREEHYTRANGEKMVVLTTKLPLRDHDGHIVGLVGTSRDVADMKHTEAELKRRYAELEAIYGLSTAVTRAEALTQIYQIAMRNLMQHLEADRASVLLFDPDGVLRFKAWHGLSDQYRQTVEGHTPWSPDTINPSPITVDDAELDPSLDGLRNTLRSEGIRALGFIPLVGEGRLLGKIMTYYNQPHAFTEEELRFAQTVASHTAFAIERQLAEQARASLLEREQKARAEAEKADQLKLQFLGMISHELRTPLASIKGFTSTLLAPDITWDEAQQREFLSIADTEADKLTDLVEQLLEVSRLHGGTLRIRPGTRRMTDILEVAAAQLHATSAGHSLVLDVPDDLPPVLADEQRVAQVLVNLVSNAAKYSAENTPIQLAAKCDEPGFLTIEVSDEGEGIPPEDRTSVFEPFRQLDRRAKPKGAGLGLAICKGLVEAHGGRIWVVDRPGPGASIAFTLPLARG